MPILYYLFKIYKASIVLRIKTNKILFLYIFT